MNKKAIVAYTALALAASLMPLSAIASSDDDKTFLTTAAQSDQNEIALSQLAQQKAMNPAVKHYADEMIADHTKMTATMKPFANEWAVTPPSGPDADHQAELTKLQGLTGSDFDKEYITQMVADHTKALSAFTMEAKTTQDARFRSVVTKGKTVVAEHEKMAAALDKKMS